MNKVQKIREVIEKKYECWKEKELNSHSIESEIRMSECQHLLLMLDSLQEEPVSIDFEQELYKAFGQVKDFTLGMQIAKWFYDMGKNSQEPVSEDLEEASYYFACKCHPLKTEYSTTSPNPEVIEAFKAGAKWKEEQMMAKAIGGYVIEDIEEGNGDFLLSAEYLPKSMGLKDQQRVKVIVIKID